MQGIGNALFEEMVFSDGRAAQRRPAGVSRPEHRGPARRDPPASSSRTATARGRSGPRAAARERSRAIIGALATAVADAGVPMHELPLTPERVWRRIQTRDGQGGGRMTTFKTVAVMGTGTMGPGMGAVLARAGYEVALYDTSTEALERAKAGYELAWGVLDRLETPGPSRVARSATRPTSRTRSRAPSSSSRRSPRTSSSSSGSTPSTSSTSAAEVILASNTSGIPATSDRRQPVRHPERVVVMHWSNPPHLIPMIEIVPGERTNPAAVDGRVRRRRRHRLLPRACSRRRCPGFVENRVLYAIMRECLGARGRGRRRHGGAGPQRASGASATSWRSSRRCSCWTWRAWTSTPRSASYLNPDLSNTAEVSPTIGRDLVAKGRLGMKTKGGLFDYTDEQVAALRAAARARRW